MAWSAPKLQDLSAVRCCTFWEDQQPPQMMPLLHCSRLLVLHDGFRRACTSSCAGVSVPRKEQHTNRISDDPKARDELEIVASDSGGWIPPGYIQRVGDRGVICDDGGAMRGGNRIYAMPIS